MKELHETLETINLHAQQPSQTSPPHSPLAPSLQTWGDASVHTDFFAEKLPSELQCTIFSLAVHSYSDDARLLHAETTNSPNASWLAIAGHSPGDVPLRLVIISAVCKTWRQIALNSPLLWNEIDLALPRFALLAIARSGDAPLHIRLRLDLLYVDRFMEVHSWVQLLEGQLTDPKLPLYEVIDQHRHRLTTVEINADASTITPILSNVLGAAELPSLKRLGCCILGPTRFRLLGKSWSQIEATGARVQNGSGMADFFGRLEAPALQRLHLELPRFQRFSSQFKQLTMIRFDCTTYFSFEDFQEFCCWLSTLPHLDNLHLEGCKLPSFTLVSNSHEVANTEYFNPCLRYLHITYSDGGAVTKLLRMIRPGHNVGKRVMLGPNLPAEELCAIGPTELLDLIHLVVRQTTLPINNLSLSCVDSTMLGVVTWGDGELAEIAEQSRRGTFIVHTSDADYGQAKTQFEELAEALITDISVPEAGSFSLGFSYILNVEGWTSFLARHPTITKIKAEQTQCDHLLHALQVHEAQLSSNVESIELRDCIFEGVRHEAQSWKALEEYACRRYEFGRPLTLLKLTDCTGFTEVEAGLLEQFIQNVIIRSTGHAQ